MVSLKDAALTNITPYILPSWRHVLAKSWVSRSKHYFLDLLVVLNSEAPTETLLKLPFSKVNPESVYKIWLCINNQGSIEINVSYDDPVDSEEETTIKLIQDTMTPYISRLGETLDTIEAFNEVVAKELIAYVNLPKGPKHVFTFEPEMLTITISGDTPCKLALVFENNYPEPISTLRQTALISYVEHLTSTVLGECPVNPISKFVVEQKLNTRNLLD